MVRPVLRSLGTVQLDDTVPSDDGGFAPLDRDHFGIVIHALIGPSDGPGEEVFYFTACSPSWLAGDSGFQPGLWLRARLLLPTWDYGAVVAAVEKLCRSIEEPSWATVGLKLSRYMRWEFEDKPRAIGDTR